VLKSGTAQSKPTNFNKLSTKPVVCRSGSPNNTFIVKQVWFIVKQVWMAASLNWYCRPRLLLGGGVHVISGSNQIESDPRRFNASL
jgi:hypothetical protein